MKALCFPSLSLPIILFLSLTLSRRSSGLSDPSSSLPSWRPLPNLHRRDILNIASGAAAAAISSAAGAAEGGISGHAARRSVASVDFHPVIPVWPSWGGGRVVPVSLGGQGADPFLLLAHHKHWFDPRDPLRGPFKAAGAALGLPYVDVEGFSMHPHRGMDILTYVCDGSDGFRHRDSLGGSATYRGGTAQWMRTGAGVMHEEFWETRPGRRTEIELFQLWINLPSDMKFDPPAVRYVGVGTAHPWEEAGAVGCAAVRDVGGTLDLSLSGAPSGGSSDVRARPDVQIKHVQIPPGKEWETSAPRGQSALIYVREGEAALDGTDQNVKALQSATFRPDGDMVLLRNAQSRKTLDLLLLSRKPLQEPVVLGGPIVMNSQREIDDASRQLSDGTFLDRNVALRQQAVTRKKYGLS